MYFHIKNALHCICMQAFAFESIRNVKTCNAMWEFELHFERNLHCNQMKLLEHCKEGILN